MRLGNSGEKTREYTPICLGNHMEKKIEILKILADKTRLDILGILVKEDSYVEKISALLNITPATVCYHLKRMEKAEMVKCARSQFYIMYSLNNDIFNMSLSEFIMPKEADNEEKYRKEVLKSFFKLGRLVSIPVQQKKREIVLLEIAKDFEKGRLYTEKEVNEIIHRYNEDHCTIRRDLVAFKIFDRAEGSYRRMK